MFWTDKHGICVVFPIGPLQPDGSFTRGIYVYSGSPENPDAPKMEKADDFVQVPDDNGDSWDSDNYPVGTMFYVEATAGTSLWNIEQRIHRAQANRERAAAGNLGGSTHGEAAPGVSSIFASPDTTLTQPLEEWERLGFPDKAAWKEAKRRGEI